MARAQHVLCTAVVTMTRSGNVQAGEALLASPDIDHPDGIVDIIEALEVVVAYLQQPAIPIEQLASILWQGVYALGISAAQVGAGILHIPVPVPAPQCYLLRVVEECVLDDPCHREVVEGLRPSCHAAS